MENELNDFYKTEKTLSASQKKKLKKKQREYQEQLQLDEQINSKLEVGLNEYNLLEEKLLKLGLKIHNIQADGNCLFKSIEHQLEFYKNNGHEVQVYDYRQLRKLAVENLQSNRAEYRHFLTNSTNTSSGNDMNESTEDASLNEENCESLFGDYCSKMSRDGEWGGELELLSLSQVLNLNISVFNLENNFNYGNFEGGVTLRVSYHRHQYILGAHYNSLIPV